MELLAHLTNYADDYDHDDSHDGEEATSRRMRTSQAPPAVIARDTFQVSAFVCVFNLKAKFIFT